MQRYAKNNRTFSDPFFIKKSLIRLDLGIYWFWAVLRVVLTLLPQTGYIHPDEYFQTVEVFAGDVFKTEVSIPWEFNRTFPIRSIPVIFTAVSIPFSILRFVSDFFETYAGIRIISSYSLLVIPRLTMCLISFVSDYCLFRICYLFGQNYKERLIIFSSSYVTLIFMTRTFTNSIEVTLFNVLLCMVASCIAESEKTEYQHNYLRRRYSKAETLAVRVRIIKLMKLLPKPTLKRCLPIALVTTAGFFNRPTFAFYAVAPLFCWFERGLSAPSFLLDFHLRVFVFIIYICPIICLFIIVDSAYYGYITWGEVLTCHVTLNNFVVTPLNFVRYNLDPSNLSKHGLHPRFLHVLVNIPLLFNILGICGLLVLVKLLIRSTLSYWTLLPKSQSITGMMTVSFIAPLLLLSIFPHQEPRFLTPLLIPLVFLYSHLIGDFEEECKTVVPYRKRFPKEKTAQGFMKYPLKCIAFMEKITKNIDNRYNIIGRYLTIIKIQEIVKDATESVPEESGDKAADRPGRNYLMKIWFIVNFLCAGFFGFVHQGGIYPLARHFHSEILIKPRYTTYHLVTSHVYSFPLHLLMLKPGVKSRNANFRIYELGTDDFESVHAKLTTILDECELKKRTLRRDYKVFYAFPTSLFERYVNSHGGDFRGYQFDVVESFYPHFSCEALPNLHANASVDGDLDFFRSTEIANVIDIAPVRRVMEFLHQFGLVLIQVHLPV